MGFFQSSGILNRRGFFGGTTAAPFSPSDISGLQLWLDATTGLFDATSGGNAVTTDGSAVARWEDQSGNGRHATQATLNNRPVLKTSIQNGKNVIHFDGSNDNLSLTSSISTVGSFFLVFKQLSYKNYGVLLNASTNLGLHSGTNGNYQFPSDFMSNDKINGQSITMPVFQNATKYFNNIFEILDCDTTSWNFQRISVSNESVNGQFAEIIIYDTNISSSNKDLVRTYLNTKWSVY